MKITLYPTATHARRANRDKSMVIRNRMGHFDMYPRPDIPNPNTPDQQAARGAWSRASAAWGSLSPEEKARWNAYATVHERFFDRRNVEPLTGYRVFQAAASNRQILGMAMPGAAPVLPPPAVPDRVEILPAADTSTLRLRVHHGLRAEGFRLVVAMSPATPRQSRKPDRRNGRHVRGWGEASTAPLPASGGEVVFTGCRYAVEPGQRFGVWLRVVRESDGLSSAEMALDFIRPESADTPAEGEGVDAGTEGTEWTWWTG